MKRCPQCDRTYADESISFCLADGQLLSPSYHAAPETLPLTRARATAETATQILPAPLTADRARAIIRRNLIAGAVGVPIGVIILLIQISTIPDSRNQPIATLIFAAVFGGLVYGYLFWSSFFGFPK